MTKKILSFFLSVLFLTTFYLLLATDVNAKDYSITSADFKVQLDADGSADVVETRTYQFDGSFTWADEWIDLSSKFKVQSSKLMGENYQIENFELWEGTPASPQGGKQYIESNDYSAGTFSVTNDSGKFYIKWYYRANFESKTFTLKYKIANAINVQQDISEFYSRRAE